jgi:predicted outer membrane protein
MASAGLKERIKKYQKEKGFDKKTVEEKVILHKKAYEKLGKIEKGDYNVGREFLGYD